MKEELNTISDSGLTNRGSMDRRLLIRETRVARLTRGGKYLHATMC